MLRVLAYAAESLLRGVFEQGHVLDRELARAFAENRKWGKRDRAFVSETVFEVVRWRRALAYVAEASDVPSLCVAQWLRMGLELPDWLEVSEAEIEAMKLREAKLVHQPRAIRESIPDWLDQLGETELGSDWDGELKAINQRAPVFLRVNSLRGRFEDARNWLESHGLIAEPVDGVPGALRLPPGRILPKSLRLDGRVEIQDAGSQCIVPMLSPQPGDAVLDACAGAGGKTLQIAAAMKNRGELVAMDVVPGKLEELKRRAKRAGVACVRTEIAQSDGLAAQWVNHFDRVLIDSPCSGLGTLRRQPDLKWRLRPEDLERVCEIQTEVLSKYARAVKVGGTVVYATCSVLPSENRGQVDQFTNGGPFRLMDERFISPAVHGFDGFYVAVMVRAK